MATPSAQLLPILSKLRGIQISGSGYKARCPAHDDSHRSLTVSEDGGKVLIHCHAGCTFEAISAALGTKPTEFFEHENRPAARPAPAPSQSGPPPSLERKGRTWRYTLADGSVALHKRLDMPGGEKRIWWERSGQKNLAGWRSADLPLYFPKPAVADMPVLLVEGEKAADAVCEAALKAGFQTAATACGASVTPSDDVLHALDGCFVVLWSDNDAPGRQHMDRIAYRLALTENFPAWLTWEAAPPKGDAADLMETAPDELDELLGSAAPWNEGIMPGDDPATQPDMPDVLLPRVARVLE